MAKLWDESVGSHRREVRDAIIDATAALAARHGLASVTMVQIAEEAGIGRATLYKYFSDLQGIFVAWHERLIAEHLEKLTAAAGSEGGPEQRLERTLDAYARIAHEEHGSELVQLVQRGEHVERGYRAFSGLLRDTIAEGVKRGQFREDVPPAELAIFCMNALGGAHALSSLAAVRRAVSVTVSALRRTRR